MDTKKLKILIDSLRKEHGEKEWVEFKLNYISPDEVGEYLSALSNAAALADQDSGFLVFGINDETHKVNGTTYKGSAEKVGNEEIENWLRTQLDPHTDIKFSEFLYEDQLRIVLISVDSASHRPVRFKEIEYIRVGTYKKKLKDHPEIEQKLWEKCSGRIFEKEPAITEANRDDILKLLSYPTYFDLIELPLPERNAIIEKFEQERIIVPKNGLYNITNLGGILFAKDLSQFERLSRKTIRVIQYKGKNKLRTIKEKEFTAGYAISFPEVIKYINDQLPQNEEIGRAIRKEVKMYPEIAIRELVANALVHQDFRETGTGPVIEIYDDRIEISNPGKPLIPILRFIDHNPKSRNEKLAQLMRRLKICEERGSGIDKVVFHCELYQLPAPNFSEDDTYLKVSLYAYKTLKEMDKNDKVRACYQHCVLKYVSNEQMNNQSLRERLGVAEQNYSIVSRIISDAIDAKLIKPEDPENKSNKYIRYVPIWV
jgi:predicted HTH transcriptional regulator